MDPPAPARPSVPDPDIPYRLFRALVRGPAGDDPVVAALALAARAGDAAARNALYTRLEPWLHCLAAPALRAARALPSARIEPDDVRQQIFICYVEVLRDWQPERAPFPLYLGHVLSRRLCRYVWRQAHPRETAVPAAQDGEPAFSEAG